MAMAPEPEPAVRKRELAETFSDPLAFRAWYESAVAQVYAYLFPRCGGDSALAEEMTQQTFIQAIERRSTYEGRSTDITWLCAIARHKLADHYRRLNREERRHLRLVVREIPSQAVHPGTTAVEDREVILAALRDLPPLQRAAVVLCYVDGLSVREAGAVLERSESATESLLSRARERLRQVLMERPDGR
jgi:RNA polymerase sigma-70 factor (ECF subfamily)